MYKSIIYEKKEEIALITLNRPEKLNAWTPFMAEELASAIDEAISEAVASGIEQAAVEAGFQAFFDTLAAGGTEAEAIAAADAACQAIDASC